MRYNGSIGSLRLDKYGNELVLSGVQSHYRVSGEDPEKKLPQELHKKYGNWRVGAILDAIRLSRRMGFALHIPFSTFKTDDAVADCIKAMGRAGVKYSNVVGKQKRNEWIILP